MAWNKKIKKTIFTLNVDNYAPEITKLTYPYFKQYANKIEADFYVIKNRKFPKFPPVYEKLQIYELAQKMENDWSIFLDADTFVHPDTPDITTLVSKDTIVHNGQDFSPLRFRPDRFFLRSGSRFGSCNWLTMASDWCIDLWKPLDDLTLEEAIKNIFPIQDELLTVIKPEHLIDDYTLSRNVAKYGLKATNLIDIFKEYGNYNDFFWHQYQITIPEKITYLKNVIRRSKMTQKERIEEDKKNGNNN
jgi:hypothetical protein